MTVWGSVGFIYLTTNGEPTLTVVVDTMCKVSPFPLLCPLFNPKADMGVLKGTR